MTSLTTKVNAHMCPYCGYVYNRVTSLEGKTPDDGSIGLCIDCGEWHIFAGPEAQPRKPTDDELVEIWQDEGARNVRGAWLMINSARQR